jgi:plasmid stability protein
MATINIRNIDDAAHRRIRAAAAARGWSLGRYLAQLSLLHEAVRARADAGDEALRAELDALGLDTISA